MRIIEKIVSAVGRRVDESSPLVDARLADGSRVNVIIPPLALDGPIMSIRRFGADPLMVDDLVEAGALTLPIVELLRGVVRSRLNILISGGTGSGKTTLLNVVSGFIPGGERIVTIEDSAELQLKQEHVVRLETRPSNIEGKGQINQRDLVINSLRMRPDRIIVGEVRGAEALDMLQAMNTGHDGSLTTIHANTPRDALTRVETMVAMAGLDMPQRSVRNQLASAIDVVIQLSRLSDGKRKLVSFQEIAGMEGEVITMQEIFKFERRGIDEDGNVLGELMPTGVRPKFADKLRLSGITLSKNLFEPNSY
jgi:pilus assembly protein CpaF